MFFGIEFLWKFMLNANTFFMIKITEKGLVFGFSIGFMQWSHLKIFFYYFLNSKRGDCSSVTFFQNKAFRER